MRSAVRGCLARHAQAGIHDLGAPPGQKRKPVNFSPSRRPGGIEGDLSLHMKVSPPEEDSPRRRSDQGTALVEVATNDRAREEPDPIGRQDRPPVQGDD